MKYLYNGYLLPQPPERYNKECISWIWLYEPWLNRTHYTASLVIQTGQPIHDLAGGSELLKHQVGAYVYSIDGESLEELSEKEWGTPEISTAELGAWLDKTVWTNTDLYYKLEDNRVGQLYLAASDPVPVPQLNPAALMQGFATMLSLRRNRNG